MRNTFSVAKTFFLAKVIEKVSRSNTLERFRIMFTANVNLHHVTGFSLNFSFRVHYFYETNR